MSDDQYTMDDDAIDAILAELDEHWSSFVGHHQSIRRTILRNAINKHMPTWYPEGGGP